MKTITEILDEIAPKYHHENYEMLICGVEDFGLERITSALSEASEIYANQSKWISVEDRLPENRTYVLSFSPNYNNIAEFKHGCFFEGLERLYNVTHWQPLPTTPPKPDLTDQ